jgi:hypothetical protein
VAGPVGRRSPWMLALLLAAAVAMVIASCGAAPRGVTGAARAGVGTATGLARAKADCAAVGRSLGAPPGGQHVWIRQIMTAPASGIVAIDAPMLGLAAALHGGSTARANRAFSDMVRACARLGLWQVYH